MNDQSHLSEILIFWFGPDRRPPEFPVEQARKWFEAGESLDEEIKTRFHCVHQRASQGFLNEWSVTPEGNLALILLLDQFSRHLYRNTAQSFAFDSQALLLCEKGLKAGQDLELGLLERWFFYMPLMHSENLPNQERSVQLFNELAESAPAPFEFPLRQALNYAEMHRDVIRRFGRFPHRNEILNRTSTPAEVEYLKNEEMPF